MHIDPDLVSERALSGEIGSMSPSYTITIVIIHGSTPPVSLVQCEGCLDLDLYTRAVSNSISCFAE